MTDSKSPQALSSIGKNNSPGHSKGIFPIETIQWLNRDSALSCQKLLGHGDTFGIWETTESMIPYMHRNKRQINFRRRIAAYLPNDIHSTPELEYLLDEGTLWLTRLALLMRLGPAGLSGSAKLKPLDVSTIARALYVEVPMIVARGLICQLDQTERSSMIFVSTIEANDLQIWWTYKPLRSELKRLTQLHNLGLWPDAPATREFKYKVTPVRGNRKPESPETVPVPHPPIPDEYLAVMGPRVLWLAKSLGPSLIHLLDELLNKLNSDDFNDRNPGKINSISINPYIKQYSDANSWRDQIGSLIIKPPFELRHGRVRSNGVRKDPTKHNAYEWPPRNWSSVQALAVTLQSSHLWITLLVLASRIGEVATLGRDCVEFAKDGKAYVNGKTYKPSRALQGNDKDWPIPDILLDVLSQQVRLVEICERLELKIQSSSGILGLDESGSHLWASLGISSLTDATKQLVGYGEALEVLAQRIGLTPKPGGKNLHPHRFRKTLARLAGLAIDGSQKVLISILGHEDVTTTLGYMQSDRAFAKEVDDVTRELRIMRGQALIEDMHASIRGQCNLPYGGHGGGGAPVLADSVRSHEEELHRTGQEWGVDTARELSVLLTNNGESARLISAHVICTKTASEIGLCSQKRGAIIPGNCQSECRNHIEDKTGRRDTERVIPILVKHAQINVVNNDWLPFQRDKKQLEQELKRYDDIGAKWRAKAEVKAILEADT